MKIIVLGGSPKGDGSITMQYVEYLRRRCPEIVLDIRQPALRIRKLENDLSAFNEIIDAVRTADGVLWAFPLYVHGVCGQMLRFIELIGERNAVDAFRDKPAAALTTSIKFFDHTAHDFIRAVSEDWGMRWAGNHSAHMRDLTKDEGRRAMDGFILSLVDSLERGVPYTRQFPTLPERRISLDPPQTRWDTGNHPSVPPKKVTVVADDAGGNLGAMIERMTSGFPAGSVNVISLRDIRIAGGCMGCLRCGPANRCAWDGKDDVRSVYEEMERSDLLVFAATVNGRWHSALMKTFIDRGFYHTHQPFLTGKQAVILLEGSLAANPPLRDYLNAYLQWQSASLAGIVATADMPDAASVAQAVEDLARRASFAMANNVTASPMFPGIAGMALFRDEIFSHLRMVFRADHKSYRKTGVYRTLPRSWSLRMLGSRIIGAVTAIPFIQTRMISNMRNFMLMPYRSVLEKAVPLSATKLRDGGTGARIGEVAGTVPDPTVA